MPPKKRRVQVQPDDDDQGDGEIKANVTESGDTISCSVEETNRIRVQLGLRPLDTGPNKASSATTQAVQNFKEAQNKEAKAKNSSILAERLVKAKERRLDEAKNVEKTLGDVDNVEDESLLSAADWVKRSRQIDIQDKKKQKEVASITAARLVEEDNDAITAAANEYTSQNLRGLGIKHDTREFVEGEQVILTLADEQVLEKDDRGHAIGVNTGADALENVNLAEAARLKDVHKRIKKSKQWKKSKQS